MAKLKLSENLFLEVAELERFRNFIVDEGWKKFAKSIVKSYGIVKDANNTYFKPTKPSEFNNRVTINPGLAFDSNINAIVSDTADTIEIPNIGNTYWIVLERDVRNTETGTVSITSTGQLTGNGTKFTEVLRGQPNFPTKIRLNSKVAQNQLDFEVVQVNSDTSAILSGVFYAETGLKYSVVGTFTPGYSPLDSNKLIYEFDDHKITLVASGTTPELTADQFILGKAWYDTYNILNVTDERQYYMFNSDNNVNVYSTNGIDPIVSLLQASVINSNNISCDLELLFEHGYTINNAILTVNESINMLSIVSGTCNFLGSTTPANDLFKGWLVINRANMISAIVSYNEGNKLYLDYAPDNLVLEEGNDLVIVPNFKGIEFQVSVNSNVEQPAKPFFVENNICNPFTRSRIYLKFPSVGGASSATVSVKYRLLDNNNSLYPYQQLGVASFINTDGDSETLSNSAFTVNVEKIEPAKIVKNYS